MKKFIVIDRYAGCRPARDGAGNILTVVADEYEEALQRANPGKYPPSVYNAQFEVMAEDYIRECLRGKTMAS